MKSPTYEHGRRRGSVFRTSDWGETEAPGDTYLWDYAEVADDDDAEFSDEHLQDRLSSYESSPASSVASRRPTDDETDGLPMRRRYSSMWEWDYREVLPSPQHKAWDCRGLPRMQIRCCELLPSSRCPPPPPTPPIPPSCRHRSVISQYCSQINPATHCHTWFALSHRPGCFLFRWGCMAWCDCCVCRPPHADRGGQGRGFHHPQEAG